MTFASPLAPDILPATAAASGVTGRKPFAAELGIGPANNRFRRHRTRRRKAPQRTSRAAHQRDFDRDSPAHKRPLQTIQRDLKAWLPEPDPGRQHINARSPAPKKPSVPAAGRLERWRSSGGCSQPGRGYQRWPRRSTCNLGVATLLADRRKPLTSRRPMTEPDGYMG